MEIFLGVDPSGKGRAMTADYLRTIRAISVVAILVALTFVFLNSRRTHQANDDLFESEKRYQELSALMSRLTTQTRANEVRKELADSSNFAANGAITKKSALSNRASEKRRRMISLIHSQPELRSLFLQAERAHFELSYGHLFRSLNLSQDQQERVVALMVTHVQRLLDDEASADVADRTQTNPSTIALVHQDDVAFESALQGELGLPAYQQFAEYNNSLEVRPLAQYFASRAASFESPLTGSQIDQLTQILSNNATASNSSSDLLLTWSDPQDNESLINNWPAVLSEAKDILTPTQFATLQVMAEHAQLSREMSQYGRQEP
jgi:hypothetical protein